MPYSGTRASTHMSRGEAVLSSCACVVSTLFLQSPLCLERADIFRHKKTCRKLVEEEEDAWNDVDDRADIV